MSRTLLLFIAFSWSLSCSGQSMVYRVEPVSRFDILIQETRALYRTTVGDFTVVPYYMSTLSTLAGRKTGSLSRKITSKYIIVALSMVNNLKVPIPLPKTTLRANRRTILPMKITKNDEAYGLTKILPLRINQPYRVITTSMPGEFSFKESRFAAYDPPLLLPGDQIVILSLFPMPLATGRPFTAIITLETGEGKKIIAIDLEEKKYRHGTGDFSLPKENDRLP